MELNQRELRIKEQRTDGTESERAKDKGTQRTDGTESERAKDKGTQRTDGTKSQETDETTNLPVLLIVSNGFCLAATLFTFFLPQKEYSNRIPGLVMVLVYVSVTSISCCIQIISDKRYSKCLSILNLLFCAILFILVITLVIINPQNSEYFPLLFIGPLLLWIIPCVCIAEWLKKHTGKNSRKLNDEYFALEESPAIGDGKIKLIVNN